MRPLIHLLLSLILATATAAHAEPWKLVLSVSDTSGNRFGATIVFDGETAYEFGESIKSPPEATYLLADPAWVDAAGGKTSLAQAVAWAAASKRRSLASLARAADPDQKAFAEMLLNPSFKIADDGKQVNFVSRFLSYTASEALPASEEMKRAFFACDELNAYRKAIVLRQAPPFAQLVVSSTLKEKGLVPGRLITKIQTPHGEVRITTTSRLGPLTKEETAELDKARAAR